jgi:hypothetical protein
MPKRNMDDVMGPCKDPGVGGRGGGGGGAAQDGASRHDGNPDRPVEQHNEEGSVGAEAAHACDDGRQRPGGDALADAAHGARKDGQERSAGD